MTGASVNSISAGAQTESRESPSGASDIDRPVFIVGCQRSGTTALAVMFDRHSRIAMLPETQFFYNYITRDRARRQGQTHRGLVERALDDLFIGQSGLSAEEILEFFAPEPPTYENLFRALLKAYAIKHNKPRVAEKSCNHLFHVDEILRLYPEAKIICILRDGRDVVKSIRSVPWGRDKQWAGICRNWNRYANEMFRVQARLHADRFTLVRYEALMQSPETELRRLCEFIGEDFEPAQLAEGTSSAVVPDVELKWKGKAKGMPDAKRVGAWRSSSTPEEIALWNQYMGRNLRRTGYADTRVTGVSLLKRLGWLFAYVPYLPGILPIAAKVNRAFWRIVGRPKPDIYYIPLE